MFFVNEGLTNILVRDVQFDAYHQTASAYLFDMWTVNGFELLHQVFTNRMGVLNQVLLFKDVQNSQCSSTGQMVATKGGTQLAVDGLELWTNQDTAHGETVGYALGDGDNVRFDAQPLMGKELTTTSVATLYLVTDKGSAIAFAGVGQVLGEFRRSHLNASYSLDALQYHGGNTAAGQFKNPRFDIVEW